MKKIKLNLEVIHTTELVNKSNKSYCLYILYAQKGRLRMLNRDMEEFFKRPKLNLRDEKYNEKYNKEDE